MMLQRESDVCHDVAEGERWVVLKLQSERDVSHEVAE